ncbi:MAG: 16S rRNA (uracil(1498)-N(3))-methyltransferase [Anaerolineae bacterium]|nr:16S rRNA (uracil(1498)-N(3))-methyltransferase [Anaerolineae bacterium]
MQRFFVSPEVLAADPLILEGALAHQLARVLRMRPDDQIILLDGLGWAYRVALDRVTATEVRGHILARWQPDTEPRLPIVLYQGVPKGKRLDWALQKSVELGVTAIVPMITRYSVRQLEAAAGDKLGRWQRIVTEAAEQSGRAREPQVEPVMGFEQACQPPPTGTLSLMACLSPQARPLSQILREIDLCATEAVRLYVGPEGGFAPKEIEHAAGARIELVSLGPRVLRSETAPLVLLSVLQYALGDLDRPAPWSS